MAGELLGKGFAIAAGNGATPTEVFTVIPGVEGIPAVPGLVIPRVVVTALDSAGEEVIPGIGSPGNLSFNIKARQATPTSTVFLPAQTVLQPWVNDGLLHNFQITFPGAIVQKVQFKAFVAKYAEAAASAGVAMTIAVTLEISGVPVRM